MESDKKYISNLVEKIQGVSGYFLSDERLIKFVESNPKNRDLDVIRSKVSSLRNGNDFHNIDLPRSIAEIQLDPMLITGDFLAVTKITDLSVSIESELWLEFASKFCAAHYPDLYPIWNRRSEIIIGNFNGRDLVRGHYVQFARYFYNFRKQFNMQKLNFFQIDKLFWIHQKELQSVLTHSAHVADKLHAYA